MADFDKKEVTQVLNKILENELAGVVRYTHYSFMIFGYHRIPIVSWLREQANEGILHAQRAGEMITLLGEHPSLSIGELLETHNHDIGAILKESLEFEGRQVKLYQKLLSMVEGKHVLLEEYARELTAEELQHQSEVDKMLRKPGDVEAFRDKN